MEFVCSDGNALDTYCFESLNCALKMTKTIQAVYLCEFTTSKMDLRISDTFAYEKIISI